MGGELMSEAHSHKHDPTLALEICLKIKNSILLECYPQETIQLIAKLNDLDGSRQGNQVATLLSLIQNYIDCCQSTDFPDHIIESIDLFLNSLLHDLSNLDLNLRLYQATITCALDGYTLNRTCH